MGPITIIEAAKWIWFHKDRTKAFVNHKLDDIVQELYDNNSYVAIDSNNNICGVAIFLKEENNTIFVRQILSLEKWVLQFFVKQFKEQYPGFQLTANRRNRFVQYNTQKFINKLYQPRLS